MYHDYSTIPPLAALHVSATWANNIRSATTRYGNKVCTAIGKNLKIQRIAADKSQETLAFDAEVDRTYISQIERGVANPSVLTLENLCYGLGITLADLFEPVKIALAPDGTLRRVNRAKPEPKPKKSRLR